MFCQKKGLVVMSSTTSLLSSSIDIPLCYHIPFFALYMIHLIQLFNGACYSF